MAFGFLIVGIISGRWNLKPLLILKSGRDSYTNGDSQLYSCVCVLGMNPGQHSYGICVLSLSDIPSPSITFQAADSIFFFKAKFSVYHHFACVYVYTSCVPGVLRTKMRVLILWNWSYRWLMEEHPEVQSLLSSPNTNFLLIHLPSL